MSTQIQINIQESNSFLTHSKFRKAARKAANANHYIPVGVEDSDELDKPVVCGEEGGYFTNGGTPIKHPTAYSKVGWSNMYYRCSTVEVLTPKNWANEFCEENFPSVIFADNKFFIHSKRHLRGVERELSKVENDLLKAPEEKKDQIYTAALSLIKDSVAFAELPSNKILNIKSALAILGYNYQQMAKRFGVELNKEEAKAWFDSIDDTPTNYLLNKKTFNHRHILRHCEPQVIQWFIDIQNDPERFHALIKMREFTGPRGEKFEYQYINKLDEIKATDLNNGIKSSVNKTFERAAERVAQEKLKQLKNKTKPLISVPDWYPGDSNNWKILLSPADLIREGDELNHCVAQYTGYVKRKKSVIFSITADDGGRSTLEFNPEEFIVEQHLGYRNSTPSQSCFNIEKELVKRINEKRN